MARVFEARGALEFDTAALMPVSELFRDEPTRQLVRMLDVSGTCVQLPQDLKTPLARYVAKAGITDFCRYTFGRVFRLEGAMEFGLAPREIAVAHFDVVAPGAAAAGGLCDAMMIETTIAALLAAGISAEDLTVHLGHTAYWEWVFKQYAAPRLNEVETKRLRKALQQSQPGRGRHLVEPTRRWTSLQQELAAAPLPDAVLQPFQALLSARNTDFSVVQKAISLAQAALHAKGGAQQHHHRHGHHRSATNSHTNSESSRLLSTIRQQLETIQQHLRVLQLGVPVHFDLGLIPHDSTLSGPVFRVVAHLKSRKMGAEMLAVGGRYSQLYHHFQAPNAPSHDVALIGVEMPIRHIEDRIASVLSQTLSRSRLAANLRLHHPAQFLQHAQHMLAQTGAAVSWAGTSSPTATAAGAAMLGAGKLVAGPSALSALGGGSPGSGNRLGGAGLDWAVPLLQQHYDVGILPDAKRPSPTVVHFELELAHQLWAAGLRVYLPADPAAGLILWHDNSAPLCLVQVRDTSPKTQLVRLKIDGMLTNDVPASEVVPRVAAFVESLHIARAALFGHSNMALASLPLTATGSLGTRGAVGASGAGGSGGVADESSGSVLGGGSAGASAATAAIGGSGVGNGLSAAAAAAAGGGAMSDAANAAAGDVGGTAAAALGIEHDKVKAFQAMANRVQMTVVVDPNVTIPQPRRRRMKDNAVSQLWPVLSSLLGVGEHSNTHVVAFAVDVANAAFHEFAAHVRLEGGVLRPLDWTPSPRCEPVHKRILEELAEQLQEAFSSRPTRNGGTGTILLLVNLGSPGDLVVRSAGL